MKKLTSLLLALAMCLALAGTATAAARPYILPSERDGVWDRGHTYIITTPLRIRKSPSNQGAILGVLEKGTAVVDLYKTANANWLAVETPNGVAYCGKQYAAEDTAARHENALIFADTPIYLSSKGTGKAGKVLAAEVVTVTGRTIGSGKKAMVPCKVGDDRVFIPGMKICYTDTILMRKKAKKGTNLLTATKKGKKDGSIKKGKSVTVSGEVGKHYQIPVRRNKALTFRYAVKSAF